MSSGEDKIRAKIKELEAEYAKTQKNKATETHLGLLKAKLSKLKRELLETSTASKKGGGAGERGFDVSKSGDTRVGLIGFPSVGKSTLLTKLTGTFSLAAGYEFTTLTAIPGTMHYRGAKIQVLDLPGIIEGAKDGKGRGRQVLSAALTCSVILIVLDALKPMTHKLIIEKELHGFGIRLNQTPPDILFRLVKLLFVMLLCCDHLLTIDYHLLTDEKRRAPSTSRPWFRSRYSHTRSCT